MQNHPIDQHASVELQQALKQFSLESARLEWIYQNLEARLIGTQENLKESHIKMAGKLTELNFLATYLKTILDHISQGIIFIDIRGIVTTYNVSAQKILGVEEQDLLFHSFSKVFPDTFFGFSLEEAMVSKVCPKTSYVNWSRSDHENVELEIETTFVVMDNEVNFLSFRHSFTAPVHGLLILVRDLTEVRRLQVVVNQNNILKELGEMAAHLAHEIRNPLGGIKGFASLLYQDLKETPQLQGMAANIIEGTDSLNRLVTAILYYTRTFQLELKSIDLLKFFTELKSFVEADVAWNHAIIFNIDSPHQELYVPIDPGLFKSAMLNLIVNAAQAMPEKGVLKITIDSNAKEALIKIADTGTGIKQEHFHKIFSPFFTTKQTGSGLCLAEVNKVVQAHAGCIGVESELCKGTIFTVKIPLKIM